MLTDTGACNTREVVLARDGTNVVQSSTCAATSGTWKSPYDGATWTAASDVDIDHMVPLSNAWKVNRAQISLLHPFLLLTHHSLAPHLGPQRAARPSPTT